ncbi:tubulin-specific chaperone A isoform X1 [Microtus pennsylvanicus]|uniref:tubulin-specific chaperone A isoform X1 n=1 Tax=Microtus pennsylvanicus TaxID=10058 RepID=UPI003F6C72E9
MADPRVRQIKIKTGVVKRLVKEKVMYEKEAKQQEEKIEKMKAEDGENYAIKKQAEILQESRMMIPDCQRRLEAAYTDLQQILPLPFGRSCVRLCVLKTHFPVTLLPRKWGML